MLISQLAPMVYYIFQLTLLVLVTWNNGAFYAAFMILLFQIGLTGLLNTSLGNSQADST